MIKGIIFIAVFTPWMIYVRKQRKKEETLKIAKNTQNFSIRCPLSGVDFYIFLGGIFLGLFMICYFYNGIFFHAFETVWLRISMYISCGGLPLWFAIRMWRLDVKGNEIRYRCFWGYQKKGQFHTISKVEETSHGSLIIYTREKRFGKISKDFIGIENFLVRCKEDGIEITECPNIQKTPKRTLTKSRIFLNSIMPLVVMGIILVVLLGIASLFMDMEVRYTPVEWAALLLLVFGIPVVPASFLSLKGLMQIIKQEQTLNFSFAEEMRSYDIKISYFINEQWYLDSGLTRIVAFRRDYIKSVSKVEYNEYSPNSEYGSGDHVCWVTVSTIDGGFTKVKSTYKTLVDLRRWFQGDMPGPRDTLVKPPPNLMVEEIAKALDAQDREGVKELFAKTLIQDVEVFDQQVENLCSYYQGKMILYDGSVSMDKSIGDYKIFTNKKNYYMRYEYQDKGASSPETGLRKIEIEPYISDEKENLNINFSQPTSVGIYIKELQE